MRSISSRFSVNVPVLSASSTVIAPTASAARSRRRRTPCCARRRPPIATSTVTRIGSSSGIVANASVSPSRSISRTGWPRATPTSGTSTHAVTATISAARASSAIARWSGVGGSLASATSRPRRPISVSAPSATTTPSPAPATTAVPACSSDDRSASGASGSTGSRPFAAATGSPVSLDSSAARPSACHDAGVGRHDAAGLDEQHVADHERVDRDPAHDACPAHQRGGGAEVAERLQRALRTDLGDRLDGADQRDHREDRDRVAQLPEDRREHADRDQQQLERLHQRLDQLAQDGRGAAAFGRFRRRAGPSRDLRRRQPTRATAEALPQDVQRLGVHRDDTRPAGGRCARHATNDTCGAQPEADRASGIMPSCGA